MEIVRHTTAQLATFIPPLGAILIDIDKDCIVVGDGVTVGGIPSVAATNPDFNGGYAQNLQSITDLSAAGTTLLFDGVSGAGVIADNANLDFLAADDFSIFMKIKPLDITRTTDYLINKEASGVGYGLYVNKSDLGVRLDDGTVDVSGVIASGILANNTITNLVVTFDRSGNAVAYAAGKQVGTKAISTVVKTLANAGALHIGNDSAGGNEFYGDINMVRLYNRALTSAEALALSAVGAAPVPHLYSAAAQTEHLDEADFASHANWDVTGDFDDSGGNCTYTWASNTTSTLTQVAADQAVNPTGLKKYRLVYTVAVTTAPDGDFAMTLTTGIASEALTLPFTAGTHTLEFMTKAVPADFVISGVCSTGTEGTFSIDDISLKSSGCVLQLEPGDVVDNFWYSKVNGLVADLSTGVNASNAAPSVAGGKHLVRVPFLYSDQSGSGAWDSGVTIPNNAIITRAWYDVLTTFGGDGDDSSTIAISVEGANDIVTATAISAGGNVFDAGIHDAVPQGDDPSTFVKTSSAKNVTVTVAINATDTALDAGSMIIFLEYVISG